MNDAPRKRQLWKQQARQKFKRKFSWARTGVACGPRSELTSTPLPVMKVSRGPRRSQESLHPVIAQTDGIGLALNPRAFVAAWCLLPLNKGLTFVVSLDVHVFPLRIAMATVSSVSAGSIVATRRVSRVGWRSSRPSQERETDCAQFCAHHGTSRGTTRCYGDWENH